MQSFANDKVDWDASENITNRSPTRGALKRIHAELKNLATSPLPGIFCVQDEVNVCIVHALIIGPLDTPYEGGFFHFLFNFPDDYPFLPPKVKLLTTGGGTVRFNPNLYKCGKVCLSTLGTWAGPGWSPIQNLGSVCLSIQSLMNENPIHNEPGFETNQSLQHIEDYNNIIRHETIRIAVIEMTNGSDMANELPESLTKIVGEMYREFLDGYILTCEENLHLDGMLMSDPFREPRGKFCYRQLLSVLNKDRG